MTDEKLPEQDKGPWSIKSVPVETRRKAMACATRQDETMAEWLARAVETQARLDAQSQVLPPAIPGRPEAGMTENGAGNTERHTSLPVLREMAEVAAIVAQASGKPLPKTIGNHLVALIDAECRKARGLPPRVPRALPPPKRNGLRIEHVAEMDVIPAES